MTHTPETGEPDVVKWARIRAFNTLAPHGMEGPDYQHALDIIRAYEAGQEAGLASRPPLAEGALDRVGLLKVLMSEYALNSLEQLDADGNYRLTGNAAERLADAILAALALAPSPPASGWRPIIADDKRGFLIARYPSSPFTWSDPCYGWRGGGVWMRWPHSFPPTHFLPFSPPEPTP